ncbi:MAG: transcriptional regulator, partial [Microbacterium sp.]|nr:transcriptional regulator [Microbacterium sp.]
MSEPANGRARVGVRDVARVAGVSAQTVSRVINDHPRIREETRRRVQDAMAQLDYRVNNAARSLDEGRWIATAYADAADAASIRAAALHLRDQGVDGLIVVAPHARTAGALTEVDAHVPIEPFNAHDGGAVQRRAAALVVAHLAELGHRRVGRLGGPADWFDEIARAEGYRGALDEHGLR